MKVSIAGFKMKHVLGEFIKARNDRPSERKAEADVAFFS
jgi:hypothetical protein